MENTQDIIQTQATQENNTQENKLDHKQIVLEKIEAILREEEKEDYSFKLWMTNINYITPKNCNLLEDPYSDEEEEITPITIIAEGSYLTLTTEHDSKTFEFVSDLIDFIDKNVDSIDFYMAQLHLECSEQL